MRFWLFEKLIEIGKNEPLRAYTDTRQQLEFPDRELFRMNLLLTQAHCQNLSECEPSRSVHTRFRTFNPLWGDHPLFHLHESSLPDVYESIPKSLVEWFIEPTGETIPKMLELRLASIADLQPDPLMDYPGRILLAQMDSSVLDGASEAESQGLIDLYDLPPIDTWFHILSSPNAKLLCAWIPEPYINLTDEGVQVSMLDNVMWMDELAPELHDSLRTV